MLLMKNISRHSLYPLEELLSISAFSSEYSMHVPISNRASRFLITNVHKHTACITDFFSFHDTYVDFTTHHAHHHTFICLHSNDRRMALIQMGSTEDATAALIVSLHMKLKMM